MKNIFILGLIILFLGGAYSQQTVNICAIRVDFQEKNDPLTTGNGLFMVDSTTTDPYAIDPAPHDRTYFNDQINAAANYYKNVTQKEIIIQGTVFPLEAKSAYKLPHEMGYYNPNTSEDATNQGLSQLFVDAINEAKTDTDIKFSDYDLVVIFHAGVGKDIGLDFDETPKDIPSLFLAEKFLKKYLGEDFDGVPVDSGTFKVSQAVILPETENQAGIALAVTGIFVNNVGNYLGLYDLFSSEKQRSGVGRFDLMDAGLFNANGLIPSPLGAFSRTLKGVDATEFLSNSRENISVARFNSDTSSTLPTTIQIPINNDEYYLVEYRGNSNLFLDSMYYEELNNSEDGKVTYLQVLKKHFADHISVSDSSGVLLSVDDYDLGLPGAGILIWHIDDRIIRENTADNTINNDPENRGVDIEEADGIEDIGQSYTFWDAGYQSELGTWLDFWYSENPAKLYKNEFSDNSTPATKSNLNRASSFIKLSGFSNNSSDVMTFDYNRDKLIDGFPVQFSQMTSNVISTTTKERYTDTELFTFSYFGDGNIYAVNSSAKGLYDDQKYLIAHAATFNNKVSLSLSDSKIEGYNVLIAVGEDSLFAFDLTLHTADTLAESKFTPQKLAAKISAPAVAIENGIWIICENDSIYQYSYDGILLSISLAVENSTDLIMGDNSSPIIALDAMNFVAVSPIFSSTQKNIVLYKQSENEINIYDESGSELMKSFSVLDSIKSQFSLADADGDGSIDILYAYGNKIYAINREGYVVTNFPIEVELHKDDCFIGTPLLINSKKDGALNIFASTKMGLIWGFDNSGVLINGFPISTGGQLDISSLQLWENSGKYGVSAVTKSGKFYSWKLHYEENEAEILWGLANYSTNNNALFDKQNIVPPTVSSLLPEERAYNYPNPNSGDITTIRYYLKENAEVTIRILDTAGDLVAQFSGPGYGAVDNEKVWNVANIASGVYLCQIEAKSSMETVNRIIKIMVVH